MQFNFQILCTFLKIRRDIMQCQSLYFISMFNKTNSVPVLWGGGACTAPGTVNYYLPIPNITFSINNHNNTVLKSTQIVTRVVVWFS